MSIRVIAARVRGGVIAPEEPVDLPEGSTVIVIVTKGEAPFAPTPQQEAVLAESIARASRGEAISPAELRRRLSI